MKNRICYDKRIHSLSGDVVFVCWNPSPSLSTANGTNEKKTPHTNLVRGRREGPGPTHPQKMGRLAIGRDGNCRMPRIVALITAACLYIPRGIEKVPE